MKKRVQVFCLTVLILVMSTICIYAADSTSILSKKDSTYGPSVTGDYVNVTALGYTSTAQTITAYYSKPSVSQPKKYCYAYVEAKHYQTITASAVKKGSIAAGSSVVTDAIARNSSSSAYTYTHKGQCYDSDSAVESEAMEGKLLDEFVFIVTQ